MRRNQMLGCLGALLFAAVGGFAGTAFAATTVPTDVQLPGTQPGEAAIESVSKCDNCHGNFANQNEPREEPWLNWAGSMMSHASRDPIFWATVAIAEQDFDGSGDLCLRCHVPEGWLDGRSTPTDGSGLAAGDADGVQCDLCHQLTRPDGSELPGVQNAPFVAHDGGSPAEPFLGSSMYVLSNENNKKGPYSDASSPHQSVQSAFHRSSDLCGTCHDVSNPVVGDLAHNNGAQVPLPAGTFSGVPGAPVQDKAAFNNPPYAYGVVERTYSEWVASPLGQTLVSNYETLPVELQAGSIETAYQAALLAGNGGDYADDTPRAFTCQTCHMRPVIGQGCDKNPPVRSDLPHHDQVGANYWAPAAIAYLDGLGQLRLGGGLTVRQLDALTDGQQRARENLEDAASLTVTDNVLRVVNLTGHKLTTGYPEGRRMWLRVTWYDALDTVLATDGKYGRIGVQVQGVDVESIVDLHDPFGKVYEVHGAMTQEWAAQLVALGSPTSLPLSYDRFTGAVTRTLGDLAAGASGTTAETFHFVLNNTVVKDTRIPPYRMDYDAAVARNILPVPAGQYGAPDSGDWFDHWDDFVLSPPEGAHRAEIELLYQPTSWEYVQFLDLANDGLNAFLGGEGAKLLDAWLNTGMAAPHTMATASWSAAGNVAACADGRDNDGDGLADAADPGCASGADVSEHGSNACDDRIDNDADGYVDYPRDSGCLTAAATSEEGAAVSALGPLSRALLVLLVAGLPWLRRLTWGRRG